MQFNLRVVHGVFKFGGIRHILALLPRRSDVVLQADAEDVLVDE